MCGTTWHRTDPDNLVYVLAMEGELFELNFHTLDCRQVFNLQKELRTQGEYSAVFVPWS